MRAAIAGFRCADSGTITYVVASAFEAGVAAAIIDPVLTYDSVSGKTSTPRLQPVADFIARHQLKVSHVLDTHVHADHVSGMAHVADACGLDPSQVTRMIGSGSWRMRTGRNPCVGFCTAAPDTFSLM